MFLFSFIWDLSDLLRSLRFCSPIYKLHLHNEMIYIKKKWTSIMHSTLFSKSYLRLLCMQRVYVHRRREQLSWSSWHHANIQPEDHKWKIHAASARHLSNYVNNILMATAIWGTAFPKDILQSNRFTVFRKVNLCGSKLTKLSFEFFLSMLLQPNIQQSIDTIV